MTDRKILETFEASRPHLRAVAFRMLGSASEADDAVQEAWIKASRAGADDVDNLGGWLTTVVARVCLDMLRAKKTRREESDPSRTNAHVVASPESASPDREALLADSISVALLVVLETLSPAERLAFVLHDMFDLPFEEIAKIEGTTPAAARQLASRARRRVQGADPNAASERPRNREVVDAFLAASRSGDMSALLAVLDPNVVFRADATAVAASKTPQGKAAPKIAPELRGREAVADAFLGRARAAQPALIGGEIGVTWAPNGVPRAVFSFVIEDGLVKSIDLVGDPAKIAALDVALLDD